MPLQTRAATETDVPTLVALGRAFRAEVYQDHLADNPERLRSTAQTLIESSDGLLLVTTNGDRIVGMIGVLVYLHHLSWERIAAEIFWYVDPLHRGGSVGIRLWEQAEQWAKTRGAIWMQMIAPNATVGAMYARRGYALVEYFYQRKLSA